MYANQTNQSPNPHHQLKGQGMHVDTMQPSHVIYHATWVMQCIHASIQASMQGKHANQIEDGLKHELGHPKRPKISGQSAPK